MKASKELLAKIHELLAEEMKRILEDRPVDENGYTVPPTASELNVIRQFLKDNGIEALAGAGDGDSAFDNLIKSAQQSVGTFAARQ